MANLNSSGLPNDIRKEFSVDTNGKGYVTLRGLARLCGISRQTWGQGGSIFTISVDKYLAAQGIQPSRGGSNGVGDTIAALVISYYANEGRNKAQQSLIAFAAIGLRTLIQQSLNWKPTDTRRLTQEEIIELCVLPVPSEWQRRFPEEYYEQLERLTNLKAEGHKRPQWWAALTKELVYDYLPPGVYEEIKRCKEQTGSWDKLHQFLSEDGLRILEKQHHQLLTLMKASSGIADLHRLLTQARTNQYQLLLF